MPLQVCYIANFRFHWDSLHLGQGQSISISYSKFIFTNKVAIASYVKVSATIKDSTCSYIATLHGFLEA